MFKRFFLFTQNITAKLSYNKKIVFFPRNKHKSSTFTPCILKFIALSFQNSFCFGSSMYQKKLLRIKKNNNLKCFYWTGMISYQWLDFRLACSMAAACLQRAQCY
jgi:hypothetical protein